LTKARRKQGYRRGYAVALIVGLESDHAVLWQVFSHVVKKHSALKLLGRRSDERARYNFHESIINALKPVFHEGVKSVMLVTPPRTDYAAGFLNHVRKHHSYLVSPGGLSSASFAELTGSADTPDKVNQLKKTEAFQKLISETTSGEADQAIDVLEKCLSSDHAVVKYALKEIEDTIYGSNRRSSSGIEYLVLTDKLLADTADKSRLHRLLQIATNKNVRTRIVNAETPAGLRIGQLGGAVFFAVPRE
jgi:stalled ribosome rescue protein Dom34